MSSRFPLKAEQGFSLVELLSVIAVIGILLGTAVSNYTLWSNSANDTVAKTDYRNLKTVVLDLITNPDAPNRVVLRNYQGPGPLPDPLQAGTISPDVEVSVLHTTTLRRNRRPATSTTISVQHLRGTKIFTYTEQNGVVSEQIVEKT